MGKEGDCSLVDGDRMILQNNRQTFKTTDKHVATNTAETLVSGVPQMRI